MISKKLKEFSSIEVNSWMAVFSFPIMILLVFIFEEKEAANIFNHSWLTYAPALYSGIIVSCLAQILMLWLYKHYEVKTVLPFYSLFPVFGILLTIILLNESISFLIITGSMIVILGNYFLQKEK
jgi:O-acetylserine/cysteine efflux transporter